MSYFTFLRTFIAVYRCGSYNKASKHLALSQPAISKQINALESQIGKNLFKRNGRGVEPTVVGDELAKSLAHHIDSIELIFNQSRKSSDEIAGAIYIGAPKEFVTAKITPVFPLLSQRKIKIVLQVTLPEKMYKLVRSNNLDLAISEHLSDKKDIGYRVIFTDELVLVASPKWASQLSTLPITPQNLSQIPLLVYAESFNYVDQYYLEVFNADSITQPAITVEDFNIIKSLLCKDAGYSVLPKYLVADDLASGKLVQLFHPQPVPQYTLYLLWNKFGVRKARNLLVRDIILKEMGNKRI